MENTCNRKKFSFPYKKILLALFVYGFSFFLCHVATFLTSLDNYPFYFLSVLIFAIPITIFSCAISTLKKEEILRKWNFESKFYKLRQKRTLVYILNIIFSLIISFILPIYLVTFSYAEYFSCIIILPIILLVRFFINIFSYKLYKAKYVEYRTAFFANIFTVIIGILIYSFFLYIFSDFSMPVLCTYQSFQNNKIAYTIAAIINNLNSVTQALLNNDLSQKLSTPIYMVLSIIVLQGGILFISLSRFFQFFFLEKKRRKSVFIPVKILDAENENVSLPENQGKKNRIGLIFFIFFFFIFAAISLSLYIFSENDQRIKYINDKTTFLTEQIADGIYRLGTASKLATLGKEFNASTKEELLKLVNEYFNEMISNTDTYLDWYYSLSHEYSELATFIAGVATNKLEEKTMEFINKHMEDKLSPEYDLNSELQFVYNNLYQEFDKAKNLILQENKIEHGNSMQSIVIKTNPSEIYKATEPQKIIDGKVKASLSLGVGLSAGIATRYVTKKLLKKLSTKLTTKAATKLVTTTAKTTVSKGVASTIGGAIGTAAGPVGTIVGTGIGLGIGILVDKLIINVDEAINRDDYKNEIVSCIEEERSFYLQQINESL